MFTRSHLRDIRDRSVLRLFESEDVVAGGLGLMGTVMGGTGGPPMGPIPTWDHDQSYFSEPEFDSDHHHQHVHKTKVCIFECFLSKVSINVKLDFADDLF